jgi:23S rRNA (adenine2030-N6)-methyltransferase
VTAPQAGRSPEKHRYRQAVPAVPAEGRAAWRGPVHGPWHSRAMLAYRHAFHAGNHADVLKHIVLAEVLAHLNSKDKGWRYVDTHAGAGGYALDGEYAERKREHDGGIGALWPRTDLPAPVARYVERVRQFNADGRLRQYPGSPAFAHAAQRPQDQLRLFELHPTDHKILASYLGDEPGVEVHLADGFAALKSALPPPTRRGAVLIDPPYEIKTDYARALGGLREALGRFAEGVVIVWLPQVQLVEAARLPQRLKASAEALARKGWLHARLTVAQADARGFGLLGSSVFVANPPHTLFATLQPLLPWLARTLGRFDGAKGFVERSQQA